MLNVMGDNNPHKSLNGNISNMAKSVNMDATAIYSNDRNVGSRASSLVLRTCSSTFADRASTAFFLSGNCFSRNDNPNLMTSTLLSVFLM